MNIQFDISFWVVLQLVILPVVLPLLVGLVTNRMTSSGRKAITLLALAVITSFLTELLAAFQSGVETFDLGMALITSLVTFAVGVGMHYGLLKPTGASAAVQSVGNTYHNDKTITLDD